MPILLAAALAALQTASAVSAPTEPPLDTDPIVASAEKAANFHFEDLFPRKPFFGKRAAGLKWSADDRYLAYLWNSYDDKGADLWVYDTQTGKSRRLTSPDVMTRYDRDVAKAVERYRKDQEDEDRMLRMNDLDYREWRLKRKEEDEKRKEPLPAYAGVSEVAWNPRKDEVLFAFHGDVYRWDLAQSQPERLTRTDDPESQLKYLPDGSGFTYRRGGGVFRVHFDSPVTEQLNPKLPDGLPLDRYSLSPDGTKLMIESSKPNGPEHQVDYITYRDRFATPKKTGRSVADDPFNDQEYLFLYDVSQDGLDKYQGDGKPWQVWKWPGGKEWQETSVNEEPWSPDSKRFTFATWNRAGHQFEIDVADVESKKLDAVYKSNPDGDQTTPSLAKPFFTRDGQKVIALLDASGYRHAWAIDPATKSASAITKGDFEAYPLKQTPDGKSLYVLANARGAAAEDVYRVDMATGAMTRVTTQDGTYGTPAISDSTNRIADSFGSWSTPNELYLLGGKEERLTVSQDDSRFAKVNVIQPKLFAYPNRVGQTIHGFMFLPPGFKKTDHRPLFIYVYGGPLGTDKSVSEGAFNSTAYLFNMYLAKVFGYVAVTIDPRGQSGYGAAFGRANYQQPGKDQVEDLTDGVKYLEANYGVDPKKVGVNGWSFGGFQTQMCMYTAPDVFTLGIAGAGPVQWQNYNNWYSQGVIGPVPNGKPEDLDKYSLTYLAKNLRSPLMLLHGVEDTNVLFQDTIKVYQKLLQYGRGPLVELVIDPTGVHGLGGDVDTRDRHAIYLGFIERWWGPYDRHATRRP